MPNMDGTGPNGAGPMTGRGMGPCGQGRGMGRGRRMGRGRGNCGVMPYQPTKEEYKKMLKEEIEDLQNELKELDN